MIARILTLPVLQEILARLAALRGRRRLGDGGERGARLGDGAARRAARHDGGLGLVAGGGQRHDADVGELRRRHAARRLHAVYPRRRRRVAGGDRRPALGAPRSRRRPASGWLDAPAWGWLAATLALAVGCGAGRAGAPPLPGRALLLPLILGTLLQDAGLLRIELPPPLLAAAYAAIGWGVGLRFDRADRAPRRPRLPGGARRRSPAWSRSAPASRRSWSFSPGSTR